MIEIKTKKQAKQYTHSLSNTSKMPCKSYGIPVRVNPALIDNMPASISARNGAVCNVGGKLQGVKNSVCNGCYAFNSDIQKGNGCYGFKSTELAMHRRLELIAGPLWVPAMIKQLQGHALFRWSDSGDIYDSEYLSKIMEVIRATPKTMHWIPTKEKALILSYFRDNGGIPKNCIVRISGAMVDGKPLDLPTGLHTSTVYKKGPAIGYACPAYKTLKNGRKLSARQINSGKKYDTGYCGKCRACWNKSIKNIAYPQH